MAKDTPSNPSQSTPPLPNPGANPGGSPSTPCPCTNATIVSQTVATVPSNRARTRLGVGESANLTFSLGDAKWSINLPDPEGGSLSTTSGAAVVYTAPERAANVTITATGHGCTKTIQFTIVEPSGVRMERKPGTLGNHRLNSASVGFIGDIYILPADVSFEHCSYREGEVDAVGSGCFQAHYASHHVGHHPNPNPIPIDAPTSDTSGSKVNGYDQIAASSSTCEGGWTWSIPWYFQVGSGLEKRFTTVDQVVAINAAGTATISKAGASNSSALGDDTEIDPLFSAP